MQGQVESIAHFGKYRELSGNLYSIDNAHCTISSKSSMRESTDVYIAHSSDQHRKSQLFAATSAMLYA